ncbi:MAG TPA: hypothetical protein VE623_19220 [Acidimicrobiales bacterium]|nr:hypothetical protein [Acidimicrobiales bacterium]
MNVQAKRALLELLADELRLGLNRPSDLDAGARGELAGLVDDLVELAMGLDARPSSHATTPFDAVYEEALR